MFYGWIEDLKSLIVKCLNGFDCCSCMEMVPCSCIGMCWDLTKNERKWNGKGMEEEKINI